MLKVIPFKDGQIFSKFKDGVDSEGNFTPATDYGAVRVQGPIEIDANNRPVQKTSLFFGNRNVLGQVQAGHEFNGRIVTMESTEPFWNDQDPVINPSTNQALSSVNGQPIYRMVQVVRADSDMVDVLLPRMKAEATAPAVTEKKEEDLAVTN